MGKGIIFSIEEFSVFDGPGLRETIFLKGCPLRCTWCHSPEGQSFENEFIKSPNGCIQCGSCLEEGRRQTGDLCLVKESIQVCPRNLIRICGEKISSEELVDRISKNLNIINASGGGVTFSGGEPLSQAEFLKECLILLTGRTNRAIQTTGYADSSVFMSILEHCDYVLYDLKHMNPDIHKQYTGVSNQCILDNYKTLATSGRNFITRIPLIPGVNDTVENITEMAGFMNQYHIKLVELLPYNKYAGSKYKMVGREYTPNFDENQEPNFHIDIFEKYDIEVNVL